MFLLKNLIGTSPVFGYRSFFERAKREKSYFKNASFLMGRTFFDRTVSNLLAPQAQYFHVDEVLRPIFYNVKKENYIKQEKIQIISTLSSSINKGIDVVLKTAQLISKNTDILFEWKIAGLDENNLIFKYFEKKLKINHKDYNIHCLGRQSPENLVKILLNSDIFIHPSYIDNSPNSVCEAQIIGLPVLAANTGGVSTLIKHELTGYLFPSNGIYELADLIKRFNEESNEFFTIGKNARKAALIRHDRSEIVNDILGIYQTMNTITD